MTLEPLAKGLDDIDFLRRSQKYKGFFVGVDRYEAAKKMACFMLQEVSEPLRKRMADIVAMIPSEEPFNTEWHKTLPEAQQETFSATCLAEGFERDFAARAVYYAAREELDNAVIFMDMKIGFSKTWQFALTELYGWEEEEALFAVRMAKNHPEMPLVRIEDVLNAHRLLGMFFTEIPQRMENLLEKSLLEDVPGRVLDPFVSLLAGANLSEEEQSTAFRLAADLTEPKKAIDMARLLHAS